MKSTLEFIGVLRSLAIFLVLMVALFWLMSPSLPRVHGIWVDLLGLAGMFGFYELVRWIYKSKISRRTRLPGFWLPVRLLAYNLRMAKSSNEPFEVGCPCCSATLKVDPETKAVISHVAAVKPKMFNDFEAAARAMREQEGRKESLFRQAVDAEKNKASLLEKKFQEAVKKAKETPDDSRPIRDFDLD